MSIITIIIIIIIIIITIIILISRQTDITRRTEFLAKAKLVFLLIFGWPGWDFGDDNEGQAEVFPVALLDDDAHGDVDDDVSESQE